MGFESFCHTQGIVDEPVIEAELAHRFGDGLTEPDEILENTEGEAAKTSDVFRAEASANTAAILIEVPVDDVMNAVDGPVASIDAEDTLGRCLFWGAAGDCVGDIERALAGLFFDAFALDAIDLAELREVEIVIEPCAAPDAPGFDAAMIRWRATKSGAPRFSKNNAISRSSVGWLPLTLKG